LISNSTLETGNLNGGSFEPPFFYQKIRHKPVFGGVLFLQSVQNFGEKFSILKHFQIFER